jgi:sugar O-acyltransferase (sialic acid O-acetyltransferase NeuD family)
MAKKLIGVYGASGFGREVMPLVRESLGETANECEIVFIDDHSELAEVNSSPVLTYADFLSRTASSKAVTVAIANSEIRQKIFAKLQGDGIGLLEIKASNVIILAEVSIGPGSILSPFVTLTSNIKVGAGFQANIYSYVGHDCLIGDFVTFAPGVKCNGNVVIADHAYIGTGAILKQGRPGKPLSIGAGAVVGMGAVVTKSVPAGVTVIGNPAKPLTKEALRG